MGVGWEGGCGSGREAVGREAVGEGGCGGVRLGLGGRLWDGREAVGWEEGCGMGGRLWGGGGGGRLWGYREWG